MRPGLLALDADGTLLDSRHRVTPAVARAVRRVRARGIPVVLATSRPPRATWPILVELGLVEPMLVEPGLVEPGLVEPMLVEPGLVEPGLVEPLPFIASQGALTGSYSPEGRLRILERRPMPADRALAVVALAERHGLSVSWFAGERWLVARIDPLIEQEARIVGMWPTVADLSGESQGPEKLLLLAAGPAPRLALAGVTIAGSTPTHLEVTARGVDKAGALARVSRRLGIGPGKVLAMGDGLNDVAMLRWAGTAVVPANGHAAARAVADLVAPTNDEDAVAWLVDRLFPDSRRTGAD